jgi:hypothetical protein
MCRRWLRKLVLAGLAAVLLAAVIPTSRRFLLSYVAPPTKMVVWRTGMDFTGHPYDLAPVTIAEPQLVAPLYRDVLSLPRAAFFCPLQALVFYHVAFFRGGRLVAQIDAVPDGCEPVTVYWGASREVLASNARFWELLSLALHVRHIHVVP